MNSSAVASMPPLATAVDNPTLDAAPSAGTEKPIILVIDDSRVIRRAITKILADEFTLIEADDGEAGWAHLLADERVQVAITDVEMPKLDGYSLICRIRASEVQRLRDLPVIVITGAQDDQTRERAFACGATDFVIKPLDSVQLLARARAHARLDQTTRKLNEAAKTLEDQTAVDPLTELHSRRYFHQRGAQDLAYAKRHDSDVGVIRIDFDNFRNIYKQYGDEMCDQMFIWLARLMRANTRTEDTPARIRGGEFAVLTTFKAHAEAVMLCQRLRTAVTDNVFEFNGVHVPLTISLGLATLKADQVDTIEDLITRAEQRLTLAKAAGGNQLSVGYEQQLPPPEESVMAQPDLDTALRMLADGEGGKLVPYLPDLVGRIVPLLELCDQELALDLGTILHAIKQRLGLGKV